MHFERADRLADLDAHGAVGVRGNAVEYGAIDRPGVYVESARTLPEGFYRRLNLEAVDDAEVDETDAAGSVGGDLFLGDPAVHRAPVVQHHVVDAIGCHGAAVADDIDEGIEDGEYAAGDGIGRA